MKSPQQVAGCLPKGFNLDSLLTVQQFAAWRQISDAKARKQISAGIVPAIRTSRKDVRIHPRTYLETGLRRKL